MGRVADKVAFISGVARGQGRSHAVRLAEEGADIIGFDVCADNPDVEYPLATADDLAETVQLVEKTGRRIRTSVLDVRDADGVKTFLDESVAELGRLDIVLANAGIMPTTGEYRFRHSAYYTGVDVMLNGVFNTVMPAIPHLRTGGRGGSIVLTSSTAGLKGTGQGDPGTMGYVAAKHGVVGLMRAWANTLAADHIRVNTVHPTGVASPMILNDAFARYVEENQDILDTMQNPLPMPNNGMLLPEDVTETVLHLVSDSGQYTTGSTVTVDAGFANRV